MEFSKKQENVIKRFLAKRRGRSNVDGSAPDEKKNEAAVAAAAANDPSRKRKGAGGARRRKRNADSGRKKRSDIDPTKKKRRRRRTRNGSRAPDTKASASVSGALDENGEIRESVAQRRFEAGKKYRAPCRSFVIPKVPLGTQRYEHRGDRPDRPFGFSGYDDHVGFNRFDRFDLEDNESRRKAAMRRYLEANSRGSRISNVTEENLKGPFPFVFFDRARFLTVRQNLSRVSAIF